MSAPANFNLQALVAKRASIQSLTADMAALPPNAEVRFAYLIDFLTKPIDDLIHETGGIDPFCVKLRELYKKYIEPVNVPWVPDALEPALIDTPAMAILEAVVRRFHEAIHKAPVVP